MNQKPVAPVQERVALVQDRVALVQERVARAQERVALVTGLHSRKTIYLSRWSKHLLLLS